MPQEHCTQATHWNGAPAPKAGRSASLKFTELRAKFDADTSPPKPPARSPSGRLRQASKSGSLQSLDPHDESSVFSVIASSMEHAGQGLAQAASAPGPSTADLDGAGPAKQPASSFKANLSAWRTATLAEQQALAKQQALALRAQSSAVARSPSISRRRSADDAPRTPGDGQQESPFGGSAREEAHQEGSDCSVSANSSPGSHGQPSNVHTPRSGHQHMGSPNSNGSHSPDQSVAEQASSPAAASPRQQHQHADWSPETDSDSSQQLHAPKQPDAAMQHDAVHPVASLGSAEQQVSDKEGRQMSGSSSSRPSDPQERQQAPHAFFASASQPSQAVQPSADTGDAAHEAAAAAAAAADIAGSAPASPGLSAANPASSDDGFGAFEDAAVPCGPPGLTASFDSPIELQDHGPHSPQSATSLDGFVPDEDLAIPSGAPQPAAISTALDPAPEQPSPQSPGSPQSSGSDHGSSTSEHAELGFSPARPQPQQDPLPGSASSDDGFGTFEDAGDAASAAPISSSTGSDQVSVAPDQPGAASPGASASDDGFGTLEDAPSRPASRAAAEPAAAPPAQATPPDSQSDASDDGFGTFEDAPSRPAESAPDLPPAGPAPPQAAEPPDSLGLPSQQFLHLAQRLFAPLAAPSVPVSLPDIARACDDMEAAAQASLPQGSPARQHRCQHRRVQAAQSMQPIIWRGSRAEAAMLRLLGLEQAAQEAAEAAAALQKQQAQARARRTSSQKISQPLAEPRSSSASDLEATAASVAAVALREPNGTLEARKSQPSQPSEAGSSQRAQAEAQAQPPAAAPLPAKQAARPSHLPGADDWQVSSFSTLPAAPPSSSKEMQPAWAPRAGSTAAMANLQAMYQEAPSPLAPRQQQAAQSTSQLAPTTSDPFAVRDPFAASGPLEVYGFGLMGPSHQPPQAQAHPSPPPFSPASLQAQALPAPAQPPVAPRPGSVVASSQAVQPQQAAAVDPFSASGPLNTPQHLGSTWSGSLAAPVQLEADAAAGPLAPQPGQQTEDAASEDSWGGFEDPAAAADQAVPEQVGDGAGLDAEDPDDSEWHWAEPAASGPLPDIGGRVIATVYQGIPIPNLSFMLPTNALQHQQNR